MKVRQRALGMTVTLSSKGQLIIPKQIRKALALTPGAKFVVKIDERKQIVLQPVAQRPSEAHRLISELRGILTGTDALRWLEEDHRTELEREEAKLRL
jgi:AbrB family looped-hinge helix DNA binding protein